MYNIFRTSSSFKTYISSCVVLGILTLELTYICLRQRNTSASDVIHAEKQQDMSPKRVVLPRFDPSILLGPKYSGKTKTFRFLCSIIDENSGNSICETSQQSNTLSSIIYKFHFEGPSSTRSLNNPDLKGQIGVPQLVDNILGNKTNGFFIECGAFDGELLSNTLYFELKRNYTGILIEPNIELYQRMVKKNRNASYINSCVSPTKFTEEYEFVNAEGVGGIKDLKVDSGIRKIRMMYENHVSNVICFPFYGILSAVGNPSVDFFSLDVEGAEVAILKTIPWSNVDIKVITIEVEHSNVDGINKLLLNVGYTLLHKLGRGCDGSVSCKHKAQDHIYVLSSFLKNKTIENP